MKLCRPVIFAVVLLLLSTVASVLVGCAGGSVTPQDVEAASRQAAGISEAINAYVRATK